MKTQVKDEATGEMVEGEIIEIVEAREPVSYVTLKDGTVISSKVSIIQAIRLVDRWDNQGQPVYNMSISASTTVNSPLRKDAGDE